jgi:hypothetical protein
MEGVQMIIPARPGLKCLILSAILIVLAPLVARGGETSKAPYLVGGNEHIVMGITLDEAAVRAALPDGLEPAADLTGGLNIYTSQGGDGVAPYTRSYVWADLEGYDSVSGSKGRYILWGASNPGAEKLQHLGYDAVKGDTTLEQAGNTVTGSTTVDGKEVMKVKIELTGEACSPAVGSLNYPGDLDGTGPMVVTQFFWSASVCAATPVSVDISVGADHALAKYKPTAVSWAVLAEDLSFSESPPFPQKMATGN